jgi:hypothetical protein
MTKIIREIMRNNFKEVLFRTIIWAVTAMNETEIEVHVNYECLDGISIKPLTFNEI